MDLPASIEAAWGLRERPHRGPKPGLSLARIVEAGVQVAEAEGLAAVSMSRVAAELGSAPMSLYRYVSAKNELVALMVDTVYREFLVPAAADKGWREGLSALAWAMRAVMYAHPWVLGVPISGLPVRPNEVAWFEQALSCLRDTGLTEAEKASVILLVSGYVRNAASTNADIEAAIRASGAAPSEWMSAYGRMLTKLTDPERFPALTRFIASGVFEHFDPPDQEFIFGMERILDGIGGLVAARSAAPADAPEPGRPPEPARPPERTLPTGPAR
jgi:AcrR family transcriptional regulator